MTVLSPPPPLPPLREVIQRHGLGARKSLGQHFLLDANLTDRIARAAGDLSGRTVIEVGPGPGGLTRSLLASPAAQVIAIEKDARCIAALAELQEAFPGRLHIHEGDALEIKVADIVAGNPQVAGPPVIVANLPYNISTALLIGWLQEIAVRADVLAGMVLMFQKEVAQRLLAEPGGKSYGRLSVLTQWLCQGRSLFDVPRQAFTPPPKVTSAIVELIPRPEPLFEAEISALERVTAAAFGQRRKMLRQSLKTLGGDAKALLQACGIAETARAETLGVEAFCALARAVAAPERPDRAC